MEGKMLWLSEPIHVNYLDHLFDWKSDPSIVRGLKFTPDGTLTKVSAELVSSHLSDKDVISIRMKISKPEKKSKLSNRDEFLKYLAVMIDEEE